MSSKQTEKQQQKNETKKKSQITSNRNHTHPKLTIPGLVKGFKTVLTVKQVTSL